MQNKNTPTEGQNSDKQEAEAALRGAACYALFCGHCYYPDGGAEDFKCFGQSIEELKDIYTDNADRWSMESSGKYADPWGQIAEASTMTVIMAIRGHGKWSEYSLHNAERTCADD